MSRPVASRSPVAGHVSAGHLSAAHLQSLARHLADATLPGPHLVRVRGGAQGVELAMLPLAEVQPEVEHPLDALVGFTAPAAWEALGVVGVGTAHHLTEAAAGSPGRERVQVAMVVARSGAQAGALAVPTGVSPPAMCAQPVEGLLVDALRRCLGLPTAAPTTSPPRWLTSRWLDDLTLQAAASRRPQGVRTRSQALSTHPLAATTCGPVGTASLQSALEALAAAGWEGLRRAAAGAPGPEAPVARAAELISPALARWADAGSLARLLEAELPPPDFLLDAAETLLPPPARSAVLAMAIPWLS